MRTRSFFINLEMNILSFLDGWIQNINRIVLIAFLRVKGVFDTIGTTNLKNLFLISEVGSESDNLLLMMEISVMS